MSAARRASVAQHTAAFVPNLVRRHELRIDPEQRPVRLVVGK